MNLQRLAGFFLRRRFWFALILLWVAWLFAPCLLGSERLAFRDIGHFYLPLYGYVGERFAADALPLWNPLDHFGVPIAGETTTAIFYPPRLLFSIGLPPEYAMTLYVVGHLLIAGGGAFWTARGSVGRTGARAIRLAPLAAAVVYPAAGPVFFLYTNPPFLVGAAWLPWALGGLMRILERPSFDSITIAGIALAMTILGGDPQIAFHAVLFAGVYFVGRVFNLPISFNGRLKTYPTKKSLFAVLACVLIASGLASLQIFAGAAWSMQSWRRHSQPPSIYSLVAASFRDVAQEPDASALRRMGEGQRPASPIPQHGADVYEYSVAPWHWAELASPFLSGRLFPIHGRWTEMIPGEPRMWTLTLFAGLLPLLCLLAGPLRPSRWTVWQGMIAAGLLLALGDFGPGRVLRGGFEILGLETPSGISDAAGGGYWSLVTFVPGYGQFRYPGKWLPFASLGMAVWTSIFLSRLTGENRQRLSRWAWGVAVVAAAMLALSWLPPFRDGLAEYARRGDFSDSFWGPLDVSAGLRSLRFSLLVTAFFASCYGLLFGGRLLKNRSLTRSSIVALALGLLVVELALSTRWQLAMVVADRPLEFAEPSDDPPRRFLAAATANDWPPRWRTHSSGERLEEVEATQRQVWFMRWHLADSAAVVNSAVSIASARSTLFWHEARRYALGLPADERRRFVQSLHRFLGLEATIDYRPRAQPRDPLPLRLRFSPVADPMPLVRWHSSWRLAESPAESPDEIAMIQAQLQSLFEEVLEREGDVVPRIEEGMLAPDRSPANPVDSESDDARATLLSWHPERVTIRVEAETAGLVTVQQFQDGFWRARIRPAAETSSDANWQTKEVHRVDVVAQGVHVPAGRHVLEFYYRPTWHLPGVLITLLTISVLTFCGYRAKCPHLLGALGDLCGKLSSRHPQSNSTTADLATEHTEFTEKFV